MKKIVCLFIGVFTCVQLFAQGVGFKSISLKEALGQAKAQGKMVFVDCYTTWCGPCKMMHSILDELKERLGDKVRILKIDVDVPANRQSVYAYQIQSVPTLMLFKKGRMLWRQSGVVRVPRLEEIIKPYLAS